MKKIAYIILLLLAATSCTKPTVTVKTVNGFYYGNELTVKTFCAFQTGSLYEFFEDSYSSRSNATSSPVLSVNRRSDGTDIAVKNLPTYGSLSLTLDAQGKLVKGPASVTNAAVLKFVIKDKAEGTWDVLLSMTMEDGTIVLFRYGGVIQ